MIRYRSVFVSLFLGVLLHSTALADGRQEIQFPDVPGYRTLKCDFHMHTVFSDGMVWPTLRVEEAWREGLDAFAITDHIDYRPHKEDMPLRHNRPYELAEEMARAHNLLLIRGVEISRDTPPGHFNVLFLKDIDPLDKPDFYEIFQQAGEQKAYVFWNHPSWQGAERGQWGEEQTKLLESKRLHAIEVCNTETYDATAHQYAIDKKLAIVGNSDMHDPTPYGERTADHHRTVTLVFAKERTLDAIREALDAGRTAVWCKNRLIGREEQLAALFTASVQISPPFQRRDPDTLCVEIRNRCELDIELQRIGEGKPAKITLPAKATSVVNLQVPAKDAADGVGYEVTNFLTAPKKPLTVKLVVPQQ